MMTRKQQWIIGGFLGLLCIVAVALLLNMEQRALRSSKLQRGFESSTQTDVSLFTVARVIDGDTIDVFTEGDATERIRFIGIDTPETVDDRKKVQCYGPEASAKMKELLTGKSVLLETKPDEDRDDYGRFLRYVILDGKDIGAKMLEEGYARSLCAAFPHPRCAEYDVLEKAARSERRGRWGACR